MKLKIRDMPNDIVSYTAQHIGKRREQQDMFMYSDAYDNFGIKTGALCVLADGMGGYEDGRLAAKAAVESFVKVYTKHFNGNVNASLTEAVQYANRIVSKLEYAGTTIAAAVIEDWNLYWISVGDSRIYLMRNGLLRRLNIEHNYSRKLKNRAYNGEISYIDALSDPNANALTSYLGMDASFEFDYNDCIFPLMKGDRILVCSDGLYKTLQDCEIADILKHGYTNPAEAIIRKTILRNNLFQDNTTVIVINII